MKRISWTLCLLLAFLLFAGASPSVQTVNFEQIYNVTPLGDATLKINFTLTASQYASWISKYGQNKALLRRDLSKFVSQYDTHSWDIQINEMERTISVSVGAHGVVNHRGGGQYQFTVPKSWRGGQINGNTVNYNYLEALSPGIVAQCNCRIVLPTVAHSIAEGTGESGERVLRYAVPLASTWNWLLIGPGVLALMLGGGLVLLGLRPSRPVSKVAITPQQVTASAPVSASSALPHESAGKPSA